MEPADDREGMIFKVEIVTVDFKNELHTSGLLQVLDSYASDPIGGGEPLRDEVRSRLIAGLKAHPTTLALMAFDGKSAVGLAICFFGFSTFHAMRLLNIHDLAVVPERRGEGIGGALLCAVEEKAMENDCCKLTLEAQEDNVRAVEIYRKFGFQDFTLGDSGPTRFFAKNLS